MVGTCIMDYKVPPPQAASSGSRTLQSIKHCLPCNIFYISRTVEPPNNGHIGGKDLVIYREAVSISEAMEVLLQSRNFTHTHTHTHIHTPHINTHTHTCTHISTHTRTHTHTHTHTFYYIHHDAHPLTVVFCLKLVHINYKDMPHI